MKKIALITHAGDPDGAFPIILARKVFENLDVYSCEIAEVDDTLKEALKKDYDKIYVVDLCMSEECVSLCENRVEVYDHHETRLHLNKYPFIHIVVENEGRKESGTSLFYQYLCKNFNVDILNKEVVKEIVELIRENDTFDFLEENKEKSFMFRTLYEIYGRERYINHFSDFIEKYDTFELKESEKTIIEVEKERTERYIEEKLKHVMFARVDKIPVGIVFAEQNRSELGHRMAEEFKDKIDIAILIDTDKKISYRAGKDEINVNVLAVPRGGGGHKHAAGNPFPPHFKKNVVELIYNNIEWNDENASKKN